MMDLFFTDPDEVPLPVEAVRIREFEVAPWPDGRRIRIAIEVDPSQKRPSVEVQIRTTAGDLVAEATVVESPTRKIEFNLHLRMPEPVGVYCAQAVLFFQELPAINGDEPALAELPARLQVDYKERNFEITS